METSAAEKKDKMDGSGFRDLPKKPSASETRGNALKEELRGVQSGVGVPCLRMSRGLSGAEPRGKGGSNAADEIYISKIRCHLGSRRSSA